MADQGLSMAQIVAQQTGFAIPGDPQATPPAAPTDPAAQAAPAAPPSPPAGPPAGATTASVSSPGVVQTPAPSTPPSVALNQGTFVQDLMTPRAAIQEPTIGAMPDTTTGNMYATSMEEIYQRTGQLSVDDINRDIATASEGARNGVGESVTEMLDKYYPPGTLEKVRQQYGGNPYLYGMALNGLVKNIAEVRGAREQELRSDVAVETVKQNWGRLSADQRNAFTAWFNVSNAALQGEKQLNLQEKIGQWNLASNWAQIAVQKYAADINLAGLDVQRAQLALTALGAGAKFDANGNLVSGGGKLGTSPKEAIEGVKELSQLIQAWQQADDKETKTILLGAINASLGFLRQYTSDPENLMTKLWTGMALGDAGVMPMLMDMMNSDPSLRPYLDNLYDPDPTKRQQARALLFHKGRAIFEQKAKDIYPDDLGKQNKLIAEFGSILAGEYLLNTSGKNAPVPRIGRSTGHWTGSGDTIQWLIENFPRLGFRSPVTVEKNPRSDASPVPTGKPTR